MKKSELRQMIKEELLNESKTPSIVFSVWPTGGKRQVYKQLSDATRDFTKYEMLETKISVIIGATNVGYLDTKKVVAELY